MSAILFDMDGTLIDSEPLWFAAEVQVMAELGADWKPSDQINCLGGPMERTERYMQELTGNVKPIGYFSERLDLVMEQKLASDLSFMPNALELISECTEAGIPLALVTASTGRQMRSVLTRFPSNTFKATISRDDVKNSKPFPDPYLLAAETIGVDIKKCLVFEDSLTGVESGLRAGAQVIGIPHLVEMQPHSNLRLINSLSEVDLVQILNWYPHMNSMVKVDD
ncbi:MAG: HAD family hydrolase [Candidatus Nanopelagicus sp.]|jgi:HAD superfamily hydrolase (TIGR01509 family)